MFHVKQIDWLKLLTLVIVLILVSLTLQRALPWEEELYCREPGKSGYDRDCMDWGVRTVLRLSE